MTDPVKTMLGQLTPELQAMAKDYARLKVEAKMLNSALSGSQRQYASLLVFVMAILRQMPNREIKFTSDDLEAYSLFKDSWQLESSFEESDGVDYQVLRLVERGAGGRKERKDAGNPWEASDA